MTRALALALALLVGMGQAVAQQQPPPASDEARKKEARAYYEEGLKYFNVGEYEYALVAYRKAYDLSGAPALLFNMAQVQRLRGDANEALQLYRSYLREQPNARNRRDVEELIRQLEKETASEPRPPEPPPAPEPAPVEPAAPPPPVAEPVPPPVAEPAPAPPPAPPPLVRDTSPPRPGRTMKVAGVVSLSAAGVLGVATIALLSSSSSASGKITSRSDDRAEWTDEDQDLWDKAQKQDRIALATGIVGGAALVTGGVLLYFGFRAAERPPVSVAPRKGGASLVLSWDF